MLILLQVSIIENVYWKELGLLVFVWIVFLALQIAKVSSTHSHMYHFEPPFNVQTLFIFFSWKQKNMPTCSVGYWVINLLQV